MPTIVTARRAATAILAVVGLTGQALAKNESDTVNVLQSPCAAPEMRQLDFWIGEWDLTWGDSGTGINVITAELNDCVILENFTTHDSIPFRGISVSTYNRKLGKWQQTWVDTEGNYLDFVGGLSEGKMILSRETVDSEGKLVLFRMVFQNIMENSLDWNWEKSPDNGHTWETLWEIHYKRKR